MTIYTVRVDAFLTKRWYLNDLLHNDHGPAVEWHDGTKEYYLHGKRHRIGGPAIECADRGKEYYLHGKRHRIDGPAIEWADGDKEYYLHGVEYTEAEWRKQPNKHKAPKAPCENKMVEVDGVKYKLVKI